MKLSKTELMFSQEILLYWGNTVANDLGGAIVGDNVKVMIIDRWGEEQTKDLLFLELQIPGGQGFDYSTVIHIDTLRDMTDRTGQTGSIMVKLNDPSKAFEVKEFFLIVISKW